MKRLESSISEVRRIRSSDFIALPEITFAHFKIFSGLTLRGSAPQRPAHCWGSALESCLLSFLTNGSLFFPRNREWFSSLAKDNVPSVPSSTSELPPLLQWRLLFGKEFSFLSFATAERTSCWFGLRYPLQGHEGELRSIQGGRLPARRCGPTEILQSVIPSYWSKNVQWKDFRSSFKMKLYLYNFHNTSFSEIGLS